MKPFDLIDTAIIILAILLATRGGIDVPVTPQAIEAVVVEETKDGTKLSSQQVIALRSLKVKEYMAAKGFTYYVVDKDRTDSNNDLIKKSVAAVVEPLPCLVVWSQDGKLVYAGPVTDEAGLLATLQRHGGT